MEIIIATYLRDDEELSASFLNFIDLLTQLKFQPILCVFTSHEFLCTAKCPIVTYMDEGRTKYARIQTLIHQYSNHIILSIDNDITINNEDLLKLIEDFSRSKACIAWGQIGVSNNGFFPSLVCIDKIVSHQIIRPVLWKLHIGISVPGQCFLFRSAKYLNVLAASDTFLDDLQIGLITNLKKFDILIKKNVIGNEKAKTSFVDLLKQRKRWASGYGAVLCSSRHLAYKALSLVLIHGFSYHAILPLIILILLLTFPICPISNVIIYTCICIIVSKLNFKLLFSSFVYPLIFTILHFYWFFHVIKTFL